MTEHVRWWENYLVRYFMPSIAGVAIVSFLLPKEVLSVILFNATNTLDTPKLTLLILYGNLFCYISSYPILCFHTTRQLDFHGYRYKTSLLDGYVATLLFAVCAGLVASFTHAGLRAALLVALVFAFSILQLLRVRRSFTSMKIKGFGDRETTILYAYLVCLSKRRGNSTSVVKATTLKPAKSGDNQERATEKTSRWRSEFIESYRHTREHGNSGFIFFLEIALAAVCYGVVQYYKDPHACLSALAVVFAIWSFPAISVHLMGQHLESRYSKFDAQAQVEKGDEIDLAD